MLVVCKEAEGGVVLGFVEWRGRISHRTAWHCDGALAVEVKARGGRVMGKRGLSQTNTNTIMHD
jgi:hypothetical protein